MIKSLEIHNFKCFKEQKIEFRNLTLLTGLNGMGKSTVLQAMLLLRQSYMMGLQQPLADTERGGLSLNGGLVKIGQAKDAMYEGAEDDRIGFELKYTGGGDKRVVWFFEYDRNSDVLQLVKDSGTVYPDGRERLFHNNFQYLQAERIGPRITYEMSDYMVRKLKWLGTSGEFTAHFLAIHGDKLDVIEPLRYKSSLHTGVTRKLRSVEISKATKLKFQVESWLSEIRPGTRLETISAPDMDEVAYRFSFETQRYVTNSYRPTNVGFGISYTLPILVAILSSHPVRYYC